MTSPEDFAGDPNLNPPSGSADRPAPGSCAGFTEVAAELALGALSGAERSMALGHLEECAACRDLLRDLSTTADDLLMAAPEIDPPAGFEVRLLARLGPSSIAAPTAPAATGAPAGLPSRQGVAAMSPMRRRLIAVAAAAAALLAVAGAGFGIGKAVTPNNANAAVRYGTLRSIPVSGQQAVDVGQVFVTSGSPSWLVMTLHDSDGTGWASCVVTENGVSKTVGVFWLRDGMGSWAVNLAGAGSSVSSARVVAANGAVLATAALAT